MAGKVVSFFTVIISHLLLIYPRWIYLFIVLQINFQIDLSIYCTVLMCLFLDIHFNLFVCLSIYLFVYLSIDLSLSILRMLFKDHQNPYFLLTMLDPCQVGIMCVNGKGAMLTPN